MERIGEAVPRNMIRKTGIQHHSVLKPGGEVEASLLSTFLQGSQSYDMNWLFKWFIKVILAFVIVIFHCRLRPIAVLLGSVLLLGGLVVLGNVIAAMIRAYRATTVPFLLGDCDGTACDECRAGPKVEQERPDSETA
jgi:hypothetical protein